MKRGGFPIVEVEWLDARSIYEQLSVQLVADKVQLCKRHSLGYLVHKDRERLILAATFDPAEKALNAHSTPDDDGVADFTVIPRQWAQRIITLVAADEKAEDGQPEA